MQMASSNATIVFDLDDTLYQEGDYVVSGLNHVSDLIQNLFGVDFKEKFLSWKNSGEVDIFGRACSELALPVEAKESFLWAYRLHYPNISLSVNAANLFGFLEQNGFQAAILTDGRSVTQRNKIRALGLSKLPVYISEDFRSEKPSMSRFCLIEQDFLSEKYFYIGDNPKKDFLAPNRLGWVTVCVRERGNNVHSQSMDGLSEEHKPKYWVDDLVEFENLVRQVCCFSN